MKEFPTPQKYHSVYVQLSLYWKMNFLFWQSEFYYRNISFLIDLMPCLQIKSSYTRLLFIFQVMERIISTKNCDPTTRSCSLLEQHLDFITAGRRCFEKMLEPVCATIDCEFKARDEEDCASMVRPINVRMYGA